MNLSDLRKVAVKKHLRIRFSLSNGMECIVNEHGIARVPSLRAVPAFNLEDELGGAQAFLVEEASAESAKSKAKPRSYARDEMAAFLASGSTTETAHDDHDE